MPIESDLSAYEELGRPLANKYGEHDRVWSLLWIVDLHTRWVLDSGGIDAKVLKAVRHVHQQLHRCIDAVEYAVEIIAEGDDEEEYCITTPDEVTVIG